MKMNKKGFVELPIIGVLLLIGFIWGTGSRKAIDDSKQPKQVVEQKK